MKPEFREDYASDQQDPVDARVGAFDWDLLDHLLGEESPDSQAPTEADVAHLAIVLRRIFGWLTADAATPRRNLDRLIGRRALAMIWVIRPDLIEGTPSLAALAKQLGETRAGLSWHTAEFSREFGIRNRAQAGKHHPRNN